MPYLFEELTEEEENELRRNKATELRHELAAKAILSGIFGAASLANPQQRKRIAQASSLARRPDNAVSSVADPITRKLAAMLIELDDHTGQHGVDAIDWVLKKKEDFTAWHNSRRKE